MPPKKRQSRRLADAEDAVVVSDEEQERTPRSSPNRKRREDAMDTMEKEVTLPSDEELQERRAARFAKSCRITRRLVGLDRRPPAKAYVGPCGDVYITGDLRYLQQRWRARWELPFHTTMKQDGKTLFRMACLKEWQKEFMPTDSEAVRTSGRRDSTPLVPPTAVANHEGFDLRASRRSEQGSEEWVFHLSGADILDRYDHVTAEKYTRTVVKMFEKAGVELEVVGKFVPCRYVLYVEVDMQTQMAKLEGNSYSLSSCVDPKVNFFALGFEADKANYCLRSREDMPATPEIVAALRRDCGGTHDARVIVNYINPPDSDDEGEEDSSGSESDVELRAERQ